MKALTLEQPGKFRFIEKEHDPLDAGQVRIRIRSIGICGTDYHAFEGTQPYFSYPRILGHELAGEVEEVSGDQFGLQIGQAVTILPYLPCGHCEACRQGKTNCCTHLNVLGVHIDGAMQESVVVPENHVIPISGLPMDQIAVIEPLSIGAHAVRRGLPQSGESVMVIGAGPIGLGVARFAKLSGATVTVVDTQPQRLDFCVGWSGADYCVLMNGEAQAKIRQCNGGEDPQVVFDATGNATSMMNALQLVGHGGRVIYVGLVQGDITFSDPEFHKRELTLMGSRNATKEDFLHVIGRLQENKIDTKAYVSHRGQFTDGDKLIPEWGKPGSGVIKAVLEL